MRSARVLCLTLAFVSVLAAVASAQAGDGRIERRELRQDARIRQGVRSGELTRGEAMRLRAGQRHVDRVEMRAGSPGPLTPHARARIDRAQNRQSRRIWRLKHNDVTR